MFEKLAVFPLIDFEAGVPLRFAFAKPKGFAVLSPPGAGYKVNPCLNRPRAPVTAAGASVGTRSEELKLKTCQVRDSTHRAENAKTCIIFESPGF